MKRKRSGSNDWFKGTYADCKTLEDVVKKSSILKKGRMNRGTISMEKLHRMFENQTGEFNVHSG